MDLILDTHVLIWFSEDDRKLPLRIKEIIENEQNRLYVSIASLWEMAIKISLNKLEINNDLGWFIDRLLNNNINIIEIKIDHLRELLELDYIHRDPFDRLIISQCKFEKISIITHDDVFKKYNIDIIKI